MPEHSTELPADQSAGHLIGRYVVRRQLGAGGFARVYCAWDPDLEIEVAIKIPKPQLADDAEALERFRREATTAARLRHPNVVTVLTVGRLDEPFDGAPVGTPYLVMDFLPEALSGRLAATPALPEPEWLRIGEEVARGLAYAHAQGVVHRDVKPDNILFGRHGEAVVTDFGIARAVSERLAPTSRSIVVGTPEYFSPEQARGLPLDGRTDVYALGVTLYRMAVGTLPFEGDDWYAIMRQHVEDAPRPPRELNPAVSPAAEQVILRTLAKRPEDRFQTAAELAASLAAVAHPSHGLAIGEGATVDLGVSPVSGRPPLAARNRRRTVAIVAGVVGVVAVAGVSAAVALARRDQAVPAPPPVDRVTLDTAPVTAPPPAPVDSVPSQVQLPESLPKPMSTVVRDGLRVSAPAEARVYVDTRFVAFGNWQADTLTVGRHEVRAVLSGAADCASATKTTVVTVARRELKAVHLAPAPCGLLGLSVTPLPATYKLSDDGDRVLFEGSLPLARPLTLPEGDYHLVVTARYCAAYDDHVHVQSGGTQTLPIKLICTG